MEIAAYISGIIFAASIGYLLVAIFCVLKFGRHLSGPPARPTERPGVTPPGRSLTPGRRLGLFLSRPGATEVR